MTTDKHTPGPWFVREIDLHESGKGVEVEASGGEVICNNQTYYPQALDPRNASLIAAAPELLEALQLCTESMRDAFPDFDHFERPAYKAAVAAISKAIGEEP